MLSHVRGPDPIRELVRRGLGDRRRRAERVHGLLAPLLLRVDRAEVEARVVLGVRVASLGRQRRGLQVERLGLDQVPLLLRRPAEAEDRRRVAGVLLKRGAKLGDGLVGRVSSHRREADPVAGLAALHRNVSTSGAPPARTVLSSTHPTGDGSKYCKWETRT